MASRFDHVVIGAAHLGDAAAIVEARLGADLTGGGKHPLMATHNRLMRLADGYLEVIAIDPDAPAPDRARWYGLDNPETAGRLADGPRALCWVAAVDDIEKAAAGCGYQCGRIIEVTRGDLHWRLTVPDDGSLAAGGILPALIEWPPGVNPVAALPDSGLALAGLRAAHPDPAMVMDCLDRLGLGQLMEITKGAPSLGFVFDRAGRELLLA